MNIHIIDGEFAVCKVEDFSGEELDCGYVFAANTDEEKSLVCPADSVPKNVIEADYGWRAFRICGVLDFSLIGILTDISNILAENKIGIFAVSTYNTDYIFIKSESFDRAISALCGRGYAVL